MCLPSRRCARTTRLRASLSCSRYLAALVSTEYPRRGRGVAANPPSEDPRGETTSRPRRGGLSERLLSRRRTTGSSSRARLAPRRRDPAGGVSWRLRIAAATRRRPPLRLSAAVPPRIVYADHLGRRRGAAATRLSARARAGPAVSRRTISCLRSAVVEPIQCLADLRLASTSATRPADDPRRPPPRPRRHCDFRFSRIAARRRLTDGPRRPGSDRADSRFQPPNAHVSWNTRRNESAPPSVASTTVTCGPRASRGRPAPRPRRHRDESPTTGPRRDSDRAGGRRRDFGPAGVSVSFARRRVVNFGQIVVEQEAYRRAEYRRSEHGRDDLRVRPRQDRHALFACAVERHIFARPPDRPRRVAEDILSRLRRDPSADDPRPQLRPARPVRGRSRARQPRRRRDPAAIDPAARSRPESVRGPPWACPCRLDRGYPVSSAAAPASSVHPLRENLSSCRVVARRATLRLALGCVKTTRAESRSASRARGSAGPVDRELARTRVVVSPSPACHRARAVRPLLLRALLTPAGHS